jgi:thiol:disulfide interchange protein DsbC
VRETVKPSRILSFWVFLVAIVYTSDSMAEDSVVASAVTQQLTQKLKLARPDLNFSVLDRPPIVGFYQVKVESGPLLFVHSSGEYLFDGDLLTIESGQIVNVLETQLTDERRRLLADLSTEDMIVFKPEGKTKAVLNVFTDVDCGYCRKLHREMAQFSDRGIEVRYLAYPRAGIPSETYNKMATAWCAEDKQTALTQLKEGKSVAGEVCEDNPIADHYRLGQLMGISGTPAVIFMDGTLFPGYQPAEAFAKLLGLNDANL